MIEREAKYGFAAQLDLLTDEQLVDRFNREVGNQGWGNARGYFVQCLIQQFAKRQIDYSSISTDGAVRFSRPIELYQDPRRVDPTDIF